MNPYGYVSKATESILDLMLPEDLEHSINHTIKVYNRADWEHCDIVATSSLCSYVFQTYGKQCSLGVAATKLYDLLDEEF
jgi:hypothetical protein